MYDLYSKWTCQVGVHSRKLSWRRVDSGAICLLLLCVVAPVVCFLGRE